MPTRQVPCLQHCGLRSQLPGALQDLLAPDRTCVLQVAAVQAGKASQCLLPWSSVRLTVPNIRQGWNANHTHVLASWGCCSLISCQEPEQNSRGSSTFCFNSINTNPGSLDGQGLVPVLGESRPSGAAY